METKRCLQCEKEKPLSDYHTNGTLSSGRQRYKPRCIPCNAEYEYQIYRSKLERAVGGKKNLKCQVCGYNKLLSALEFHHKDPSEKDRHLAAMQNYSYARIKVEIDKCVLLCCLCHREVHGGVTLLPD